jgi:hypothetical protein
MIDWGLLFTLIVLLIMIEYFQYWHYLSRKYPLTLQWLKQGSFFEKGQVGINLRVEIDLLYQKSDEFNEEYKSFDFIEEYGRLINDKRYLFRKKFLLVVFAIPVSTLFYILFGLLNRI